jgi:hypothetical protein
MRAGRWWMPGVTCLSVIVINLDLTILNIALPAISAALHAGTGDLQWLVDAYSLVFAGVMLPAGMAGDRLGGLLQHFTWHSMFWIKVPPACLPGPLPVRGPLSPRPCKSPGACHQAVPPCGPRRGRRFCTA